MKRYIKQTLSFLVIIFFSMNCYGQQDTVFIRYNSDWTNDEVNYTTDTVIFETGMRRHILTGTTILPSTSNQVAAMEYGLSFVKVDVSECQKSEGEYDELTAFKINSVIVTDSALTIDFNISENCCYSFLCDFSVDSTGTLHLLYTGYGTYCFCNCCFGLTYHIAMMKGEDIPKLKAVMIGDATKTKMVVKL